VSRRAAHRFTLEVTDLDDEGRGVGTHDAVDWHVPGVLPEERAVVEAAHRSPHRAEAWARLVTLDRPSRARVAPSCPATGRCGGCPLGALAYAAQLAWKEARLAAHLATVPEAPTPLPIFASPRPLGYRNHARLVYATDKGRPRLGAYAPRTHEVIDLAGCRVVEPVIEEVRAAILTALTAANVTAHNEATHTGALAYVALRANHLGQVHVTLVGHDLAALAPLATLRAAHPAIIGVSANERPRGNAIFGRVTRTLAGEGELAERVGGVDLLLSPTAFFQVNRDVAARVYADVADALTPSLPGRVAELYAGVGGIAMALSLAGGRDVVGVEVNEAATRDAARAAASLASPPRFIAADAARGLTEVATTPIAAIVVNPPRRGLDGAALAAIGLAAPRQLAYVSCDPETLARDLRALSAHGFALERAQAYDMHPQTAHVETLAILRRRG
jgi:23S rRNA (uracil1939-C5)-methyltransferase